MRSAYGLHIDGKEVKAQGGGTLPVVNPATGSVVTVVADAGEMDVDSAVQAAAAAFADGRWSRLRGRDRARVLQRAAVELSERLEDFAQNETMQIGRPVREMRAQLRRAPEWFEYFASVAHTAEGSVPDFGSQHINIVQRVPLGVVGLITPWNHPLLILMKKLSAALAAGNSVVIKPSEFGPVAALEVVEVLEHAGLPPGVANVVTGYGGVTGKSLVEHPGLAKVDLTGGTETGRAVAAAAGHNLIPVAVELGGKAPVVVFDDTAPDIAAAGAAFAAFIATGQTCIQGSRLLVQDAIFDEVVDRFVERARNLRVGDPLAPTTQLGPLASAAQLERVSSGIHRGQGEGATIICGGERLTTPPLDDGYYYAPTVIGDVDTSMSVWREEIFGPVVVVKAFRDEAEAIALANDARFGLAASVWTRDVARAHRVANALEAGIVWINDHHRIDPSSPWSGRKDSGIGQENGLDGYRSYTAAKSIIINTHDDSFDWYATEEDLRYS
ncbi:MAG: aldehyde dehydrogenase [Acidimicrobiales bacterium]